MASANMMYSPDSSAGQSNNASGHLSQLKVPEASNLDTPKSYEQSRRQVSSVVVAEEILGARPEHHKVTYVEVPVVQEVTKYVPKISIVEVDKYVPKYEVEETEEIVEVPQIEYVDRHVEKIIQHEPGTKLIEELTKEVVKHVPKIEYRQVEQIVEVPGEEIEVPIIKREAGVEYQNPDQEIPVVVAQTIRPVLTEVYDRNEKVDVYQYNPSAQPVDVFVPKPVQSHLVVLGPVSEEHRPVTIPTAHYNTILKQVNQHLPEEDIAYLPCQIDPNYGKVVFLHASHTPGIAHYPGVDIPAVEQAQEQQRSAELQKMRMFSTEGQNTDFNSPTGNSTHASQNNTATYQPRMLTMTTAMPPNASYNPERLSTIRSKASERMSTAYQQTIPHQYQPNMSTEQDQINRQMTKMSTLPREGADSYPVDRMMEEGLIDQPVTVDYVQPKPRSLFGGKRLGCGC